MSILEVQAVSKAFGGIQALDDCSLVVEQGTITGLIGPNGSGKTTLFNVITGYERVDTGEIRFDGRAITGETPARIFGLGIGRTFQLTRIFPHLTVLENMHVALPRNIGGLLKHWGSSQEQRQAMDLLDFVSLTSLKNEPAGNLSYGQKKLLEFALILVAQPQMILLDEPAGGVNPTMVNELARGIRTLNRQKNITFLVVEHNMEFVMGLCHMVNVMHRGTKIAEGPPQAVRKNPAVLDAYLGV
ncbi:MAG: ABC transporter ATP-binding protein [Chloroflexi bacterium 13_1_20CM_54_36]|jgi:ABC-type branched-subunit amino acid transport system ATPase component|nr:MAG: ABC transporter ATP-binding protein [Ktedonobacter sp. 13_2_20CM_53_11]OLB57465.1 MAG: ABC transporter ATP-binding protein [Ktedonobacter sp. 13_2_20CM_2_56_8]OLD84113.1 MAG: ABC transporter ATP-binding protein [Chloroflexi bacterium 13_1_20CM_54_36]OLE01699.1 MAG: ABC transporter ATP-binding protein [Ktedonobacter sp. 13_1_20CM_4_53_11]OLE34231.1 MAG: ABC transporter ATP-binding protein [Ktedonobacter sp. 13_1_20CM_3_54_15]